MTSLRVVVLADTHLRSGRPRRLPAPVEAALGAAGAVLHAGDLVEAPVVDELRRSARGAPVHAVLGNNDHGLTLPTQLELDLAGVRVGMVHETGATAGRDARVHRRFPTAALVVYGHSHAPDCHRGIEGQWVFNPGSPTERRRQPWPSFGVVDLAAGAVRSLALVRADTGDVVARYDG